jgi:hypothetical protein
MDPALMPRLSTAGLLLALGCSGGTEPSTNPADLRVDVRATATVWGYVAAAPASSQVRRQQRVRFTEPVVEVVVELGRWEGPTIDQTFRGAPADSTGPQWARWVRIARTTTDGTGRYRFARVPRYEVVSVMVEGSNLHHYEALGRFEAHLPESIFWLAATPVRQENLMVWDRSR